MVYSKIRVNNLKQSKYFHITQTFPQTMSACLRLFTCLSLTMQWWVKYMVIWAEHFENPQKFVHTVFTQLRFFPYLNPQHRINYNAAENKNPIHLPWCSKMAEWNWNGVKWYFFLNVTRSMSCLRYSIFSYALTNHSWSWTQIFLSKYWLIISRQPVLYTTHSFGPIVNSTYKDKICHILQTFPMANFAKFSLAPAPAGLSKLS